LILYYDGTLSKLAFKVNLRRYTEAQPVVRVEKPAAGGKPSRAVPFPALIPF